MIPKERSERPSNYREGEWQGQKVPYYSNRIIVKFRPIPEDSERTADEVIEDVRKAIPNGFLLRAPRASGRVVFGVDPTADVIKLAEELSKRADVEYAEPDIIDQAQVIPSDTRYSDQWALPKVNAPTAWDIETGSASGLLIGIIDSGISMSAGGSLDHPDLNDASRYTLGTDFVDGGTPRDLNGHGTHVAGIAGAESNNAQGICGINWSTPFYICRTLDANGSGSSADFADAVEEIVDYAVARSLKVVINYSGGGGANQTKQDACQYVNDHGMILCAAAGNNYGGPVIYPAAYSTMFNGVIAVGSTNSDDTVSDFSCVGPEVTVVAPGRHILSTMPTYSVTIPATLNYDYLDGTSMATPLVTGLVALIWSHHPGYTNAKVRDCLTSTTQKLGAATFNNSWGYGRVDANKAVHYGAIIFTGFTHFTSFTKFTLFTRFSLFSPFTRFTRYTRFIPFSRFPEPGPEVPRQPVRPFIRFGNTVFAPEELRIARFEEFASVVHDLEKAGIETLDELAVSDPEEVSRILGLIPQDANTLVELAQKMMNLLAEGQ